MARYKEGVWVIGDVHGEYEKLTKLLAKLPADATVCFVGDVVDKGAKSAKVLDLIIEKNYLCVLGNHEIMMLTCSYEEDKEHKAWLGCGGEETLRSYKNRTIPHAHYEWLSRLPYFHYFKIDDKRLPLVVSHSYIHKVWIDEKHKYTPKEAKDILWKKMKKPEDFDPKKEKKNGIFNIFGHTPVQSPVISDYWAMIDTGATYTKKKDFGKLTALHYPSMKIVQS